MSIIPEQSDEKQHTVEGFQIKNCDDLVGDQQLISNESLNTYNLCHKWTTLLIMLHCN